MLSINSRFNLVREGSGAMVERSENTGDTLRIAQIREQLAAASPEEREQLASELNSVQERRAGGDNQVGAGVNGNQTSGTNTAPSSEGKALLEEGSSIINSIPKSATKGTESTPVVRIQEILNVIGKLINAILTIGQAKVALGEEGNSTAKADSMLTNAAAALQQEQINLQGSELSYQDDIKKQKEQHPEKPAGV